MFESPRGHHSYRALSLAGALRLTAMWLQSSRLRRLAGLVALVGLTLQCAPSTSQESPAAADWHGTGVVVALLPPPSSLHAARPVIIIHHDPIPGLMDEAMDMPFIAASTDLFRKLRPGNHIAFGLKNTPEALLVISIERLPSR